MSMIILNSNYRYLRIVFYSIFLLSFFSNFGFCNENVEYPDVLIIYSSGTPYKTISQLKPKDLDGITSATPLETNCKSISFTLLNLFKENDLHVKAVNVIEITNSEILLKPKLIVLGSPSRFWNVSWEMKRFFDEILGEVYVKHKKVFQNIRFAAFSMAEIEGSARETLDAMERAVSDCGGKINHMEIFLTNQNKAQIYQQVKSFKKDIERLLTD